jgi:hypothetical protein
LRQSLSAFSAFSARIIALRIENPYNSLRQIANLPQRGVLGFVCCVLFMMGHVLYGHALFASMTVNCH